MAASILSRLRGLVQLSPDSLAALAPGGKPLSRAELLVQVDAIASTLSSVGLQRGDIVAVILPDGISLFRTFLGVATVAVCAPLNPASSRAEIELHFGELRPRALVLESRHAMPAALAVAKTMDIPVLTAAELLTGSTIPLHNRPPAQGPESAALALVLFTSATTGRAKVVPVTGQALIAMAAVTQSALALTPHDRFLCMMPLFHLQGLLSAVVQLLAGGSVVFTPGFDAESFPYWMDSFAPTWYTASPALHAAIVALPDRPAGSLRFVRSIGARMAPELLTEIETALGVPVLEGYGMTEAGLVTSTELPPGRRKPGSVGRTWGPELAILGDAGAPLPPEHEGEIAVRGPSVMSAYRENQVATRQVFRDGWFLTGDLGRLDAEGFLFITGRAKEMINRGGEKVLPGEIDDILLTHSAVAQAAAFGRPHPTLGEDVAAAVVLHPGAAVHEWDLRVHVAAHLAVHKVPRRIFVTSSLPLGPTGKIRRSDLADLFPAALSAPQPARTETERRIAEIWRRVLGIDAVGIDHDFFELGGDSLAVTLLMAELEEEFGPPAARLDESTFFEIPTIATLAGLLGPTAAPVRPAVCQTLQRRPFVALQRHGTCAPFFCIPGADENPYYFRELAQSLGDDQPFYVVRDPRSMEHRDSYSVEDVAARILAQISKVQPAGPYFLGGHCFGAIVAYEIARQLVARDQSIGRLVMFEGPAPGYPKLARHWKDYGREVFAVARGARSIGAQELQAHARVVSRLARKKAAALSRSALAAMGLATAARRLDLLPHPNVAAGHDYRIKPLAAAVTQFVAADEHHTATVLDDPLLAWREFVHGEFEVISTPGAADRIFRQPHVEPLAAQLRTVLERATTAPQSRLSQTQRSTAPQSAQMSDDPTPYRR